MLFCRQGIIGALQTIVPKVNKIMLETHLVRLQEEKER